MPYFAPYIDETGYHMPSYTDIRDDLISTAKQIFGQDIYLGNDTQDYQFISAVASKIYDVCLANQAIYNSRGPSGAVGTGLDSIVGINGITRKSKSASTVTVVLTGTPGTVINNGVVSDTNGVKWNLPSPLTITSSGTVSALAICQTLGAIFAPPNTIINIETPTLGWTSVTNPEQATPGTDVESDAKLRTRQANSTANPSRTVLEGIKGSIAAVAGVTRYQVYENDTGQTNSMGHPPHSVTAVVEGGSDQDVAESIFKRKTPGCYTNGTTEVDVTDAYGQITPIRFYRPTYVDIDVVVTVKKLAGYTTQTTSDIQSYVADYINSIFFGSELAISSLWGAALQANRVPTNPYFSITSLTAAKSGEPHGTTDISLLFYEAAKGAETNVTVNFV
ncbi:baseplate J/gp47 family protein [Brevibacillus borstelensis]|uniref:baseplate J/gp47 family protein n=1 Tax=Brevibacillus borstelensis TaxID=45462 RepID=UPI00068F177B|nr:baseplate J/gp47 family protein [Brevibacillus borstelensis]KKX52447.1 phage Mu protein gp47-like protein [Brevibacillus borstelensis cifa_chp40]